MVTSINNWWSAFDIYRYKNLVYLRTLKCASTYYSKFFSEQGWQYNTADTIDWDNDQVFSFIMDPYKRRLKGLTEFIVGNNKQELLSQDRLFWGGVLYLDMHSIPYFTCYGERVNDIDWIPLDIVLDNKDSRIVTEELLSKMLFDRYQLQYTFPAKKEHTSSLEKIKIYKYLEEIIGHGNYAMHLGLTRDIELYHQVVTRTCTWKLLTGSWDQDISWKRKI